MKRKHFTMQITVSVNGWMNSAQARREVRTLINNQSNWLHHGGPNNGFEEPIVKAIKVEPAKKVSDAVR